MDSSQKKQLAELRVVPRRGGEYAVALRATIRGDDLYSGVDREPRGELLRTSWHESGATHTYVYNSKRVPGGKGTPLSEFTGLLKLWSAGSDPKGLDWSYKPKKDSATRRTLIVDLETVPQLWSIDCWALEPEGDDPVDDLVDEAFSETTRFGVVVSSVRVDWTHPQLLAIVWTPRPEVLASLDAIAPALEAMARDRNSRAGPEPSRRRPPRLWTPPPPRGRV